MQVYLAVQSEGDQHLQAYRQLLFLLLDKGGSDQDDTNKIVLLRQCKEQINKITSVYWVHDYNSINDIQYKSPNWTIWGQ